MNLRNTSQRLNGAGKDVSGVEELILVIKRGTSMHRLATHVYVRNGKSVSFMNSI